MITNITIKNYKSIIDVPLSLSRVNVFIGENGAGKSNILEAIALVGAASANKLDNEFLASRGVRITQAEYMRPAFPGTNSTESISISVVDSHGESKEFLLSNDNEPYSKWECKVADNAIASLGLNGLIETVKDFSTHAKENGTNKDEAKKIVLEFVDTIVRNLSDSSPSKAESSETESFFSSTFKMESENDNNLKRKFIELILSKTHLCKELENFIIYSPEHTALRTFQREGQVEPLGINGEGLLKLISVIAEDSDKSCLEEIKASLKLLGWFEDFKLINDIMSYSRMEVKDSYIDSEKRYFDQMSTNEGFLFLLFYFAAITSKLTPKFFAIDNIDASLNPKLCEGLVKKMVFFAKKHDKQIVLTTHNPATLDGLNLDDDEQRLFVVSRGRSGETKVKRIKKPLSKEGSSPVRLSEMFIKGILGGLPKGF